MNGIRAGVIAMVLATGVVLATGANAAPSAMAIAADKEAIAEMGARFDNALDSEDEQAFVGVFTPTGALQGFWGSSSGPAEIAKALQFMLATFAKDKRHVVTNHVIEVNGNHATMYCYLIVFDRKQLAVTGTATFHDTLEKRDGQWRFVKRVLTTDPNVQPIIDSLSKK